MKKIYSLLFCLVVGVCGYSQTVTIPDAVFKTVLTSIDANEDNSYMAMDEEYNPITIDLNSDGEIQLSEAETVFTLIINYEELGTITDITGIESFSNLKTIEISMQSIAVADFTEMDSLETLHWVNNSTESLDIQG